MSDMIKAIRAETEEENQRLSVAVEPSRRMR
jgi:hypothetical protein